MPSCHIKTQASLLTIILHRLLFLFFLFSIAMQTQAQQPDSATAVPLKHDTAEALVMLPLKLTDFSGKPNKDIVQLVWTTAAEANVNHFELEKSANGIQFTVVNKQTGKGIAAGNAAYQAEDFKPATGINYYRLKIVCNDGKAAYSKMILVKYKLQ